jgi:hypothetical protein
VTRLLGHFSFNEPASLYFEQYPPTSRDLDRELERFPDFFEQWLNRTKSEDDCAYFRDAFKLDHAIRQVFGSPASSPLVLDPALGAEVIALQLVMSDSCALYSEAWPLLAERRIILAAPGESPWPRLEKLSAPNHALIRRATSGIAVEFLRPEEARLYGLLSSRTVGEALALWEQEVASPDVAAMATAWLQKAMRLGLWKTYRRGA